MRSVLVLVLSLSIGSAASAQSLQLPAPRPERAQEQRRSDSVLNGALIGAGVAVASGLAFCRLTESWENCRDDYGPMLRIGAIGAGIGIAIDALIRDRRAPAPAAGSTRVYVAPAVGRRAAGLHLLIRF